MGNNKETNEIIVIGQRVPPQQELVHCVESMLSVCRYVLKLFLNKDVPFDVATARQVESFQLYYVPNGKCEGPDFSYDGPYLFLQNNLVPLVLPVLSSTPSSTVDVGCDDVLQDTDSQDSETYPSAPSPFGVMFLDEKKGDVTNSLDTDVSEKRKLSDSVVQKRASEKLGTKSVPQNVMSPVEVKHTPKLSSAPSTLPMASRDQGKVDLAANKTQVVCTRKRRRDCPGEKKYLYAYIKSLLNKEKFNQTPILSEDGDGQQQLKKLQFDENYQLFERKKFEIKASLDRFLSAFVAEKVERPDVSVEDKPETEKLHNLPGHSAAFRSPVETGIFPFGPNSQAKTNKKPKLTVEELLSDVSDISAGSDEDVCFSFSEEEEEDEIRRFIAHNCERDALRGWTNLQRLFAETYMRKLQLLNNDEFVGLYELQDHQCNDTLQFSCALQSSLLVFEDGDLCILSVCSDVYECPQDRISVERLKKFDPSNIVCVPNCFFTPHFNHLLFCGMNFKDISWAYLPAYMKLNNRESFILCLYAPHCRMFFFDREQLDEHLKKHVCNICSIAHPRAVSLESHVAIHTTSDLPGIYFCCCYGCVMYFHEKVELTKHILEDHRCPNCHHLFGRDELFDHKETCSLEEVEAKLARRLPFDCQAEMLSKSLSKYRESELASAKAPEASACFAVDLPQETSASETEISLLKSREHLEGDLKGRPESLACRSQSSSSKFKAITKASTGLVIIVMEHTFPCCNRLSQTKSDSKQVSKEPMVAKSLALQGCLGSEDMKACEESSVVLVEQANFLDLKEVTRYEVSGCFICVEEGEVASAKACKRRKRIPAEVRDKQAEHNYGKKEHPSYLHKTTEDMPSSSSRKNPNEMTRYEVSGSFICVEEGEVESAKACKRRKRIPAKFGDKQAEHNYGKQAHPSDLHKTTEGMPSSSSRKNPNEMDLSVPPDSDENLSKDSCGNSSSLPDPKEAKAQEMGPKVTASSSQSIDTDADETTVDLEVDNSRSEKPEERAASVSEELSFSSESAFDEFKPVRPMVIPKQFLGKKLRVVNIADIGNKPLKSFAAPDARFLVCQCCGFECECYVHLVKHIQTHFRRPETIPSFVLNKLKQSCGVLRDVQLFLCSECGMCFDSMNDFSGHKRGHRQLVWPCKFCGKSFQHQSEVDLHIKYFHSPDVYSHRCKVCCMSFVSKEALALHTSSVHHN